MYTTAIPNAQTYPAGKYWFCFWLYLGFFALLLGIKIGLIAVYGSLAPFWDQWDAEALYLYVPFLQDSLHWQDLLGAHNEHRILTTRLLALGLLTWAGEWNPLLQMTVNAVIHVTCLVVLSFLVRRLLGVRLLPALLLFSTVLFGIPYAYENTLAGFQSQFYFVIFFSIAGLYLIVTAEAWRWRWWFGLGCALLAFLSFASGLLVLVAACAAGGLQYITGSVKYRRRHLFALLVLVLLFIAGYVITPQIAGHAVLKAGSLGQFWQALIEIVSWPNEGSAGVAALMLLPGLVFLFIVVWQRPACKDVRWFVCALVLWALAQVASVAYGRATGALAPRYLDLFAVLILINFICVLALFRMCSPDRQTWGVLVVSAWVLLVGSGLVSLVTGTLPAQLIHRHSEAQAHVKSLCRYLAGEQMAALPGYSLPYPDPERLRQIMDIPEVRRILPTRLNSVSDDRGKAVGGSGLSVLDAIFENYVTIISFGIWALLIAILLAGGVWMKDGETPDLRV